MSRDEEAETRREGPGATPDPTPVARTAFDPEGERFELGEELGRGGMGRVVAATDRALAREVAIEQVLTDADVDIARFEREVPITARLEHPAIVPIHDAGRDRQGRPYYVMRRLDGEHLSDRVAAAPTARARLALVPHVLAAVDAAAFAHARRIIHRDIKPWNILVGEYGETLLIDWGLARELDDSELPVVVDSSRDQAKLTRAGGVFGTPGYMAPEQARGEPADARVDVYALGATLLHVLTGKSVLGEASATAWLDRVTRGGAVPLAEVPSEVPRELIAIVAKAMAEQRSARYRDAGELAADLRAFLAGQLVAAHRYTRRERIARFVRRNRVAVAITGAAVVAMAVIATIAFRNVIEERDLARAAREDAEVERQTALKERSLANERSDTMLLDRAATLTTADPTRAVALLRQLSPTPHNLRRARDITEAAAFRGIAHGLVTRLKSITLMQFTPDGTKLVVVGEGEAVYVIDVATASYRTIATPPSSSVARLLDDRHLVINGFHRGLAILDVIDGGRTMIDPQAVAHEIFKIDADRFQYLDGRTATLVGVSLSNRTTKVIAQQARSGFAIGTRIAIADGKRLRILDGTSEVAFPTTPDFLTSPLVATDPERGRFAFAGAGEIVEWDVTGKQTRKWQLPRASAIEYSSGGTLYAMTHDGSAFTLFETATHISRISVPMWRTRFRDGIVMLAPDGGVTAIIGVHVMRFPFDQPQSRVIAVSPDDRYVAVGTYEGTIRWFDARLMVPEMYPSDPTEQACWVENNDLFLAGPERLRAITRGTGQSRTLVEFEEGPPLKCLGRLGTSFVLSAPHHTRFIRVDGSSVVRPFHGYLDREISRFVHLRGRDLVDFEPDSNTERVVWTAPETLGNFASAGRWGIAVIASGMTYRIDRKTAAVASIQLEPSTTFAIRKDGVVGFVRDRQLLEWDGSTTRVVTDLPTGEVVHVSTVTGGWGLRVADGSLWFAGADGLKQRAPASPVGFLGFGPDDLAWRIVTYQKLYRTHLHTGEQLVLELPVTMLVRASDQLSASSTNFRALVIEERVPRDPTQLFEWLDTTTNARLDATGALHWLAEERK